MYVSPFWFGVLMTIVVEILIVIVATVIGIIKENDDAGNTGKSD